ncbi:MAG TPA: ATP-binding protein [Gemmatimonadales bacterium]|nr:ATP-binding protein [Gemmatimonadales bacterium]
MGPVVPPVPPRGLERLAIPGPRPLLAGILVVRLILVSLALGLEFGPAAPRDAASASIEALSLLALGGSAWLFWALRRAVVPGPNALLVQAAIDVFVVTALVTFNLTEAATSVAALYVALVTVYALVLPVGRGLFTVALAIGCYVAVTLHSPVNPPDPTFWTQVGVIGFVGALIAVLGNRLTNTSNEQRVLTAALAQARLEAHEILATIQSGVMTVNGDGRLGYLNPRGRRILGGGGAFVLGQPVLEVLRARSRELHDAISRGLTDGSRVARGEAAVRRADGTLFPVGLSTTTFTRPGTDRRLVTAIFTDISDLKRLQEFRLRAERLEAVAALSASLAHEIRNPLAAIRSAVEQLARSAGKGEDEQTLAALVMRESERLNRLLSEFLDFSRVRAGTFEQLDLTALARDAVRVAQEHPATRGVTIHVAGEATMLDADQDLMHRIVSNLVLNAAQALGPRGTVTVTAGRAEPGEAPAGSAERPIKLIVRDDGPGIPESVRERLFEPFVTGRPGGTGLGLAIVQRAVAAHRGIILVDTAPSAGTTFSIFLPETWNRESGA